MAVLTCAAMAQTVRWLDVPFVAQKPNGCGSAVISMVMQYWNAHGRQIPAETLDPDQIQAELYSPEERGIKTSAMSRYFQEHGFRSFAIKGQLHDLANHIAKGRPLIVALAPAQPSQPIHYVVVAGVNTSENVVLVNDPARRKLLKMDMRDFDKAWSRTDRWTLLVVPKT
ncbi:MAG TPA: C39 family peptidase [Terriglobales bacterium]|nr:C39 family peptidase [Terriglobales bacterium]